MHSLLEAIIKQKQLEVAALKNTSEKITGMRPRRHKSLKSMLHKDTLSIIGEIKRASPSKGRLADIPEPSHLVRDYVAGGVNAISVLTDEQFFSGSINDLIQVGEILAATTIPVLRKDFIIDDIQIHEACQAGADAILLIVSVLKEKTQTLLNTAKALGIDAIVEVHDAHETEYAIDIGAEIIGVNNRNLHSFEEDINVSLELIKLIPSHIVSISESAIKTQDDIKRINNAGFNAVLIGEALVKSANSHQLLEAFRGVL